MWHTEPRAKIVSSSPVLEVAKGSTISLTCTVNLQASLILWWAINYVKQIVLVSRASCFLLLFSHFLLILFNNCHIKQQIREREEKKEEKNKKLSLFQSTYFSTLFLFFYYSMMLLLLLLLCVVAIIEKVSQFYYSWFSARRHELGEWKDEWWYNKSFDVNKSKFSW